MREATVVGSDQSEKPTGGCVQSVHEGNRKP